MATNLTVQFVHNGQACRSNQVDQPNRRRCTLLQPGAIEPLAEGDATVLEGNRPGVRNHICLKRNPVCQVCGGLNHDNLAGKNDANFLYLRFTLQQSADPINAWTTYIWLDNDNNGATGFNPFGNPNFGSSLMIINDNVFQQAGGGWNEGTITPANAAYGANAIPGTDFEYRISRSVVGVSGAFNAVPLLDSPTIGVQLASETGTGDSLPAWANYGALSYTYAPVPEPTTFALAGLGLLLLTGRTVRASRNLRRTNDHR